MEKKLNPRCCLCGDILSIASFDVSSPHMCCDCLSKTLYSDHKVPEMTKQTIEETAQVYAGIERHMVGTMGRGHARDMFIAFLAGAKEGAKREREKWEEKILKALEIRSKGCELGWSDTKTCNPQCGSCAMADFIEEQRK